MHFYHLHALDWVDVVSALSADPTSTSQLAQAISSWPKSSPGYFADLQKQLKTFVESGQLGIFANGYWGHPAYKLPPEANLLAVAHYLETLDWQKDIAKIHTIFGGKNPHPNYLVGGMACAINIENDNTINMERLNLVKKEIDRAIEIVEQVYLPDLFAIGSFYKDWTYGGGVSNYLSCGEFPIPGDTDSRNWLFPSGVILDRNLSEVIDIDPRNPEEIQEFVDRSWYEYQGGASGLHPFDGQTNHKYSGPKPPYDLLDVEGKYSWLKTPRWKGKAMEVGPLARVLVGYARGKSEFREVVDGALGKLGLGPEALFTAIGRTLARGLETKIIAYHLRDLFNQLVANIKAGDSSVFTKDKWDPATWPKTARGVGMFEAPRGALGHWVTIENGKIKHYQAVVPSTWNASPRDGSNQRGPYEEALVGVPMHDPEQPLEILRVIHSFDPCIACAAHVVDMKTQKSFEVKVR